MTSGTETMTLRGAAALGELESEWKALELADPFATPFQTFAWHLAWANTLGAKKRLEFVTVRSEGQLIGLLPLCRQSAALWSTVRFQCTGVSDVLQPLVHPEFRSIVGAAFRRHLESERSLVDLHQIRSSSVLNEALSTELTDQAKCVVLDLPETYEAYLATLGKSLRFDCRKLEKKPFTTGEAKILTVDGSNWQWGLDVLFETHRERWKERHLPGAFLAKQQAFHRAWVPLALEQGLVRLNVLEFEGKAIGALYAFTFHDTTYFYQTGFNPTYKTLSPGTVLVAATIRQAIEEGKKHFDFMRGDEPYKRRWQPQNEVVNRRYVRANANPTTQLGRAWTQQVEKIEIRIRAKLEGHAEKPVKNLVPVSPSAENSKEV